MVVVTVIARRARSGVTVARLLLSILIDLELRVAADGVRSIKVIDKRSIPCMSEPTITCSSVVL